MSGVQTSPQQTPVALPEKQKNIVVDSVYKYEGQMIGDKQHGFGQGYGLPMNQFYQGDFKDNKFDGEGIFYTYETPPNNNSKCFFKGIFQQGHQVQGIQIFPNGDTYEGNYKFYGNQRGSLFQGRGVLYNNSMGKSLTNRGITTSNYKYDGMFKEGKRDGYGQQNYISGSVYEGQFKNNYRHGKGQLKYADGTIYYGDFVRGMPYGFGVQIAYSRNRIRSLQVTNKDYGSDIQEIFNKNDQEQNTEIHHHQSKPGQVQANIEQGEQYYYEGEWVEGYKHGIGRLYEPDGSYSYCRWEYDKKVGEIIHYNVQKHKWKIYRYKDVKDVKGGNQLNPIDHYISPDQLNEKYQAFIVTIGKEHDGFPPNEIDAYKSVIDQCGISGERIEDPDFPPSEDSLGLTAEEIQQYRTIEFIRINDNEHLRKERQYELFKKQIKPNQFIIQDQNFDYQLLTCLQAMTMYPNLFFKILSPQYDLENVGYIMLKFYQHGVWKEVFVDEYMPCFQSDHIPIFPNTDAQEIGWMVIQKGMAQLQSQYYSHIKNKNQMCEIYLQMLTGMPCQHVSLGEQHMATQGGQMLWSELKEPISVKQFTGLFPKRPVKEEPSQIRIAYLRKEYAEKKKIPLNFPYILVAIIDDSLGATMEESMDEQFFIMQTMDPEYQIEEIRDDLLKDIQKLKIYQNEVGDFHKNYFVVSLKVFTEIFQDVYILQGQDYIVQNSINISQQITDFSQNDYRFFIQFSVNLPTNILINIEQIVEDSIGGGKVDFVPVRIVLCSEKDNFASSKQEFLKNQFARGLASDLKRKRQEKQNREINLGKSGDNEQEQQKKELTEQDLDSLKPIEPEYDDFNKQKQLQYSYIFGRGQNQLKNMFKSVWIETGQYMLMIQLQSPEQKENQVQIKSLNVTASIFAESMIPIRHIEEPENFLRLLYENFILMAEKKFQQLNHLPENFQQSDLSEREHGSNDLIIIQYFLTWEGTYLHYMQNQSDDKCWRQKLYFRTENMQIIDQGDQHKVDVQLMPKTEALIIIQQTGAQQYTLQGGEGICIIDKLLSNEKEEEEAEKLKQEKKPTFSLALKNIRKQREKEEKAQQMLRQAEKQV